MLEHRLRAGSRPRNSPEFWRICLCPTPSRSALSRFPPRPRGILVVFCDDALKFGAATRKALGTAADTVKRAAAANQFKGKSGSTLDILAPEGIKAARLIVVGAGKPSAI